MSEKWIPLDKSSLEQLYVDEWRSVYNISRLLGIAPSIVWRWLDWLKIPKTDYSFHWGLWLLAILAMVGNFMVAKWIARGI